MPDNSILWIAAAGAQPRELIERAEGNEVYTRYPWDAPPLRNRSLIISGYVQLIRDRCDSFTRTRLIKAWISAQAAMPVKTATIFGELA